MTLPDPLAAEGVVTTDPTTRSLYVLPAEPRSHAGLLWSKGHRALSRAGYPSNVPTVWAAGPGLDHHSIQGQPVEGGAVRFQFPRGDPAYMDLATSSQLSAYVTVDRKTGHILAVRFRGRKAV